MSQQLEITDQQWSALKSEFCKGFTEEQANVCRTFCELRSLIPGKHVVFQIRRSKEWDEAVNAKIEVSKIVFITTIDAARLIALRSQEYVGQDPETYIYLNEDGGDFIESSIPLPQLPIVKGQTALPREPWAVRTTVYRKSFSHPITSVARFDAYASTYKSANGPQLTEMWQKRGPEQLAKCSEMLSLRKSFPEELSSLYLDLELKNESEAQPAAVTPASVVPLPVVVPKVSQVPAVPTEAPRPNEKMPVETAKAVLEVLPKLEEFVSNPAVQEQLAAEGKKVDYEEIERLKAAAKAAVPDLKPASELPPPEKKKRGPKPKNPENGQPEKPVDGGITQADIDNASKPESKVDEAALKQEATEFVDSITNFTAEEAAEQGLPEPPEYSLIPTKGSEQLKGFGNRVRALVSAGVSNPAIKNYLLDLGKKKSTDLLTVGDWTNALNTLEGLPIEQAKEVTRNAPLPEF